jgi:arabinofuranosyltransferase
MQSRALNLLAGAFTLTLVCSLFYSNRGFFHDDAFISLRYARHLVDGLGLVWNEGEFVQGYSNFLHVIITASLGSMGFDFITAARIVGLASYVGVLLVLLVFSVRDASLKPGLRYVPVILAAVSSPLIIWTLGGLETILFTFFITSGCLWVADLIERNVKSVAAIAIGLLFGLAALTRPDGLLMAAVSIAWLGFYALRAGSFSKPVMAIGSLLTVLIPYLIWVQNYYGDVLPNTFYTKASGFSFARLDFGLDYLVSFIFSPPYLPILMSVFGIVCWLRGAWRPKQSYLLAIILAQCCYVVWVGGDQMPSYRFMAPIVGLLSYLTVLNINGAVVAAHVSFYQYVPILAAAVASLQLFSDLSLQLFSDKLNPRGINKAAFVGQSVGLYINDHWPKGSLIALNTAGSTPYFADKNTYIDMLGLNDRHIARRDISPADVRLPWQSVPGHRKGDGEYVLDRQPDYIIVGPAEGTLIEHPWFLSDLEMSEDLRFKKQYILRVAKVLDSQGKAFDFVYYERN